MVFETRDFFAGFVKIDQKRGAFAHRKLLPNLADIVEINQTHSTG
jgi:hypothetical protein